MATNKEKEDDNTKKSGSTLTLTGKTLSLKGGAGKPAAGARSGASSVAVEVRRTRKPTGSTNQSSNAKGQEDLQLTNDERETRARALQAALSGESKRKEMPKRRVMTLEDKKAQDAEARTAEEQLEKEKDAEEIKTSSEQTTSSTTSNKIDKDAGTDQPRRTTSSVKSSTSPASFNEDEQKPKPTDFKRVVKSYDIDSESESVKDKNKKAVTKTPTRSTDDRRGGRITVTQALNREYERDRGPSLAAQKRAREKARLASQPFNEPTQKMVREVILPEVITVGELANRMAEPGAEVVKTLMKMGVMATITQTLDADTAELVVSEFGHTVKRVTDADIEIGLDGDTDIDIDLIPRPPVVTIMGHVDHGKTSLLDALRSTDVVAGEAGGITQHIGAYQVQLSSGARITFLDTPGHAAFTEMRARGANVTDIVVIVVAANDSIMPQTIEAINHAKAAGVPIIVAINKIDLYDANPAKVKQDLLQYNVVIEEMGGDTQCVEISAKKKINLDKLEETILLQAEILELRANPDRLAKGYVIEAKMERGRGSVGTVLIQTGTLKVGDIFVAGAVYGKVRALIDDKGKMIQQALPGQPVEVLGANNTPMAGDLFNVTGEETKARQIAEYRQRKIKDIAAASAIKGRTTMEQLVLQREAGTLTKLPVLIRADVQGSVEAIAGALKKMTEENEGIAIQVLHSGVGGITESDVILARASGALIIGFNVRANMQARDLASREGTDIRYYNIIYNVIDDVKALLGGMLSPNIREEYLGQSLIKQVFNVTKVGKVAGCFISTGTVKRGSKVRLLRDDIVIHEGMLKTLRRFKEEVKEVKEGFECGMAFENYDDIKEGDIIECYELIEEERIIT